jgi:hypothetical protein
LYGWGPDAIKLDNEDESISATGAAGFSDLAVYYGIVGWSRDAISIGLIGSLLYFLAYASVFRTAFIALKGPDFDHYAEMLGFGACAGVLALMVCYLIYASTFASIGAITFPLTFAVGIVSSPTQVLNRPARSAQLLGSAPA